MQGNREGKAKTFPTFRASTKCREIEKVGRRLSNTIRASTKCREIGKTGQRLSLPLGPEGNRE